MPSRASRSLKPRPQGRQCGWLALAVAVAVGSLVVGWLSVRVDLLPAERLVVAGHRLSAPWSHTADCRRNAAPQPVFPGCQPTRCGRVVMDDVVTLEEALALRAFADGIMANYSAGGAGGPTILDLHSGALSHESHFINVVPLLARRGLALEDFPGLQVYRTVHAKVMAAVASHFGVTGLHLTKPTFFSRITAKPALTLNDEYWHPHVDQTTYPGFEYTCLLYLSTQGTDFDGGAFAFLDPWAGFESLPRRQRQIEPALARLSCFTSGAENEHRVLPVTRGVRFALTYGFTCNPTSAIAM